MDKFVLAKLIFFCCCWNIFPQQEMMAYESLIDYSFQNIESPSTADAMAPWKSTRPSDISEVLPVSIHKYLSDISHVSHFQCGVSTLRIYTDEDNNLSNIQESVSQVSCKIVGRPQIRQLILPDKSICPYAKDTALQKANGIPGMLFPWKSPSPSKPNFICK